MPRSGKCPNYAGCLLAYRNETISVEDDAPFVCPECKQPLTSSGKAGSKPVAIPQIIVGGIALLVIMASAAVYYQVRHMGQRLENSGGQIGTSFEQGEIAGSQHEFLPSRHMEIATPTPEPDGSPAAAPADTSGGATAAASPFPTDAGDTGVTAQTPNLDLRDAQNKAVKDEVLKRIDLMPTISQDDKDKLYMSVDRARRMGKILTIPFPSGHTTVSPTDITQLRAALASAQLQPLTRDPTCVFVVLGFADQKGDAKTNIHISTQRAESVMKALSDQCGILNVMHAVGMGGSTLFGDEKDAERNRVVEVWAVLP